MKAIIIVLTQITDKGKRNHGQSYVKKVFSKFSDKYQKILQKNQIYIMIQKSSFSAN